MLDVRRLATLREVVRRGSFSAAGQALALTQPAVSRQISLLERQLGTPLVTRTRQGVHATEAGRLLVDHADALLARLDLAEQEVAELAGRRRGRIRLGIFYTAAAHLGPELRARTELAYPDILVEAELADRRDTFSGLMSGALDLGIVFEHAFEPSPAPPEIKIVPLFDEPLRVILPPGHRLVRRRRVSVAELERDTWIQAHDGSATWMRRRRASRWPGGRMTRNGSSNSGTILTSGGAGLGSNACSKTMARSMAPDSSPLKASRRSASSASTRMSG